MAPFVAVCRTIIADVQMGLKEDLDSLDCWSRLTESPTHSISIMSCGMYIGGIFLSN